MSLRDRKRRAARAAAQVEIPTPPVDNTPQATVEPVEPIETVEAEAEPVSARDIPTPKASKKKNTTPAGGALPQ